MINRLAAGRGFGEGQPRQHLLQNAVLLYHILDEMLLVAIDPSREGEEQHRARRQRTYDITTAWSTEVERQEENGERSLGWGGAVQESGGRRSPSRKRDQRNGVRS